MNREWTGLRRVLTALGHQEPDRVPLFLTLTMHGARALGLSIQEYYSRPENMVEGQLRLRARYDHDCLIGYTFAGAEMSAWGSQPRYFDDGSPNAGPPIIDSPTEIAKLEPPDIGKAPLIQQMLRVQSELKARVGDDVPIVGLVVSPISLPVMQMGFTNYIRAIYEYPDALKRLFRINEEFCVTLANAQFAAGATVIAYADPLSSPTMISHAFFRETGLPIMRRSIARMKGPVAITFASADCLSILNQILDAGAVATTIGATEDLAAAKQIGRGRITLIGNLNNLAMPDWSPEQAEAEVRKAIELGAEGGGFILCDQHGEVPWQTPETVLEAISEAAHRWGTYPIG
jgi:uroporphyrinogen decarboxylase